MTVGDFLTDAIRDGRVSDARGRLHLAGVDALSTELSSAGVRPRHGVGVSMENGRRCTEAYVSLARLGAVAVCIPPATPADQRAALLRAAGCRLFIDDTGIQPVSGASEPVNWLDGIHWVLHSSGSTGIPKAIALTWDAVVKNARDTMATLGSADGDYLHLGSMSQCYANGLYNSFLLPLVTGGRAHIGPVATIAGFGSYLRTVREFSPDILWVNPVVATALSRRAGAEDVASARMLISCTAPLGREACILAEARLKRPVLQSYGLAETLIVSMEHPQRSAVDEFSAGLPVAGPRSIAVGARGTLEVSNGAVTPGYTRLEGGEVICELPDGISGQTFVTSDTGEIDAAGRLHVLGRITGVINAGGVKIGAEQLEEVLRGFPGVTNVVVIKIALEDGRERAGAVLETARDIDLEAAALHCVEKMGVAARPAVLRAVRKLPMTSTGKVDRREAELLLATHPS